MELTDIMSIEKWKQLVEDLNISFGYNGTVYYTDNSIFVKSDGWANTICPAIKSGDTRIVCASAQQAISKKAMETKSLIIGECDIGFTKFVIPIFANNKFIGMIGGCGCVTGNATVDAFYISKLLKKENIEDLLISVQQISQKKLTESVRYIQEFMNFPAVEQAIQQSSHGSAFSF
ncbi:MAG: PocR ligand-binding domain-containing protein [Nitrospirota bacterium]